MSEQALQALTFLSKHGPSRLGTAINILDRLVKRGLIMRTEPSLREYSLTAYGKGVLREINRAGTEAMINRMEMYLT